MKILSVPAEEPGGRRLHGDAEHRPIINITNAKIAVVQLTPHVTYRHSAETVLRLRELFGKGKGAAQDGNMVRHPAGTPTDGTIVHAFPVAYASIDGATAAEATIRSAMEEFESEIPDAKFLGFVAGATGAVYDLVTAEAKAEQARRMALLEKADGKPEFHLVTREGDVTNVDGTAAALESSYEVPLGDGQHGQKAGDDGGAEGARM